MWRHELCVFAAVRDAPAYVWRNFDWNLLIALVPPSTIQNLLEAVVLLLSALVNRTELEILNELASLFPQQTLQASGVTIERHCKRSDVRQMGAILRVIKVEQMVRKRQLAAQSRRRRHINRSVICAPAALRKSQRSGADASCFRERPALVPQRSAVSREQQFSILCPAGSCDLQENEHGTTDRGALWKPLQQSAWLSIPFNRPFRWPAAPASAYDTASTTAPDEFSLPSNPPLPALEAAEAAEVISLKPAETTIEKAARFASPPARFALSPTTQPFPAVPAPYVGDRSISSALPCDTALLPAKTGEVEAGSTATSPSTSPARPPSVPARPPSAGQKRAPAEIFSRAKLTLVDRRPQTGTRSVMLQKAKYSAFFGGRGSQKSMGVQCDSLPPNAGKKSRITPRSPCAHSLNVNGGDHLRHYKIRRRSPADSGDSDSSELVAMLCVS